MNTFSTKFNPLDIKHLKDIFIKENASFSTPKYMFFQARGEGYTASFYESGKFVIQGKNTEALVAKYFGGTAPKAEEFNVSYPHIGIDESGKGDFFGPLVIAGVYLDEKAAEKLKTLGICDSKKLNDKKILELEPLIKESGTFDIIAISPKKYNELYSKFKNLNKLLAWGHSSVLENLLLKTDAKIAISDQFASENVIISALKERGKTIKLIQRHRAEEDTAVAAASILARAEFVKRLSALSYTYGINLPKGASEAVVQAAKNFSQKIGKEELKNAAKVHFKTFETL